MLSCLECGFIVFVGFRDCPIGMNYPSERFAEVRLIAISVGCLLDHTDFRQRCYISPRSATFSSHRCHLPLSTRSKHLAWPTPPLQAGCGNSLPRQILIFSMTKTELLKVLQLLVLCVPVTPDKGLIQEESKTALHQILGVLLLSLSPMLLSPLLLVLS